MCVFGSHTLNARARFCSLNGVSMNQKYRSKLAASMKMPGDGAEFSATEFRLMSSHGITSSCQGGTTTYAITTQLTQRD